MHLKATIAYFGKPFFGWQKTPFGPSIEESLELAAFHFYQKTLTFEAASRTDRGVHAENQIVCFRPPPKHNLETTLKGLNYYLPKEIVCKHVEEVNESFHPTLDALGKIYTYQVTLAPFQSPFSKDISWHVYQKVDLSLIQEVIPFFIGEKDFASFCTDLESANYSSTIREIKAFSLREIEENEWVFTIEGNHFPHHMVRNIIGTVIDIGRGKMAASSLPHIFTSRKREKAGVSAPAHGLTLRHVLY